MAKGETNFRVFDEMGQGMLSDAAYEASAQRAGGVALGVADPALHNKLYRQATVMAAAIAEHMARQGVDALDTDKDALADAIAQAFKSGLVAGDGIEIVDGVISATGGELPSDVLKLDDVLQAVTAGNKYPISSAAVIAYVGQQLEQHITAALEVGY